MPELPEVETLRRMLAEVVLGRRIHAVRLSGARLRAAIPRSLPRRLRGRTLVAVGRHGKYLFLHLDAGLTLVSHLGMSGRWLFIPAPPPAPPPHVHARLAFDDGAALWFQDPRRFGLLHLVATDRLGTHPGLARLGPDPLATPPSGAGLLALARGARVAVKGFLLDQRRLAGLGNIYASEILFRARVDPRCRSGALGLAEWEAIAAEIPLVLREAVARMGTTFRTYRTIWDEPGRFAERLAVYGRGGEPCRRCRTPIRRVVQGQRATFFCPRCQVSGGGAAPSVGRRPDETLGRSRRGAPRRAQPPGARRARRATASRPVI